MQSSFARALARCSLERVFIRVALSLNVGKEIVIGAVAALDAKSHDLSPYLSALSK